MSNDRLRGPSAGPLSSFNCSSSQPTQAPPCWAGPAPGTPAGGGQSLVRCRHFGVPGAGWGATQLSSSLQRQEEDGHGRPELRAGLAGDSTAGHHHHCDGRERGDRPGLWSARQGQEVAGSQAGCGRAPFSALEVGIGLNAHRLTHQHRWEVGWGGGSQPARARSWL